MTLVPLLFLACVGTALAVVATAAVVFALLGWRSRDADQRQYALAVLDRLTGLCAAITRARSGDRA